MKRCTMLLVAFFCVCKLSAQKTVFYFGENKEKIQFETIDTLSYVLFKANVTDIQKRIVMRNSQKNIPLNGRSMLLNIDSESEIMQLRDNNNIEAAYRMLRSEDGDMHVLRGEILVKINIEENVESVFSHLNIPYISEKPIEGLENVFLVCIPSPDQTLDVVNKLAVSELVIYAEPNFITFTKVPTFIAATSDNYDFRQWAIENVTYGFDVNVLPAWKISKGENVKVAVIDDGIDLDHPDLKANLLPGYDTVDEGTSNKNGGASSNDFHGTACAGIIAAVENNIGVTGIAPKCKIIPVRIAEAAEMIDYQYSWKRYSDSSIANGIIKAYQNGADILSCSFGILPGGNLKRTLKEAIAAASTQGRNGRGSIVVFASGNESLKEINPYGLLDNVISVGSMNSIGERASSSNYGNGLKVVAPGVAIYTTDVSGTLGFDSSDYCYFGGTSAACPHVAGIAALLLSIKPDAPASSVISWICSSCKKLPAYQYSVKDSYGTWNNETGYGLVDAYGAIAACNPFTLNVPDVICDCETYTFSVSGPTERCDSIVWDLGTSENIVSGSGVNSVEARIDYESGCSVPLRASLYYGDKRPIEVEAWAHSGVPETYDIIGADEATEWEYMFVEAIMEGATSYTWELLKGNCGIWPNGNKAQIMPYDTKPVTICVTGYNRCGSWFEWISFAAEPRKSYMKSRQAVGAKAVAVYTLSYNLVYSDKNLVAPFDIKTTNLSPGFYIIEYQFEDGTATREKVYVP